MEQVSLSTSSIAAPSVEKFKALQSLPVSAAVLDSTGEILAVNDAWKQFGRCNGLTLPAFGVGANYLAHCGEQFGQDLRKLLAGKLHILTQVYPCHSGEEKLWFMMLAMPLALSRPCHVAVVHANISALLPLPLSDLGIAAAGVEGSIGAALTKQLQDMLAPPRDDTQLARLTKRQKEILMLIGKGQSNKEIARSIGRSDETVKVHVAAILRQLEVRNRTEAALLASRLPLSE